MTAAKYSEIRNQIKRATFRVVLSTEFLDNANLIVSGYVLEMKSREDKEDQNKAGYVARGHLKIMKIYLVHGVQAIECVSVRITLVVVNAKGFRIWVVEVKLAYLQSD